jgi:hypothetical protein
MSGLSTLCGVGPLIIVQGKPVQLRGRTLKHLAEVETQIMYLRGDPLFYARCFAMRVPNYDDRVALLEGILPAIRHKWIGCKGSDLNRYYRSPEGRAMSYWQATRDSSGQSFLEAQEDYCRECEDQGYGWSHKIEWSIDVATGDADVCYIYEILNLSESTSSEDEGFMRERSSLFSSLIKEPFNISPADVANLTLGQISLMVRKADEQVEDVSNEKSVLVMQAKKHTRILRKEYTERYRVMAENIASGRPALAGLTKG